MLRSLLPSITLLFAASTPALAQPAPPPDGGSVSTTAALDEPSVAITWSPVHLVIPFAEFTAEIRAADKIGVSVIAGAGATRIAMTDELIKLFEAGISPRYYVLGTFRKGVQIGAEAVYVHAFANDFTGASVTASGLSVGPYAGYKYTHGSGFTFEGQLGASYMAIRGKGNMTSASESKIGPLLNLQVGWSF